MDTNNMLTDERRRKELVRRYSELFGANFSKVTSPLWWRDCLCGKRYYEPNSDCACPDCGGHQVKRSAAPGRLSFRTCATDGCEGSVAGNQVYCFACEQNSGSGIFSGGAGDPRAYLRAIGQDDLRNP